jgi:hypothetical protein
MPHPSHGVRHADEVGGTSETIFVDGGHRVSKRMREMAEGVSYEQSVVEELASTLYVRARWLVVTYSVLGLVIGGAGSALGTGGDRPAIIGVVALASLLFGYAIGSERASALKLQALTALCQVQIEVNTRTAAVSAARASLKG